MLTLRFAMVSSASINYQNAKCITTEPLKGVQSYNHQKLLIKIKDELILIVDQNYWSNFLDCLTFGLLM